MKILMVIQHANFFRNLDTVIRALGARGDEIVILHGTRRASNQAVSGERLADELPTPRTAGRGIALAAAEMENVTVGLRPKPRSPLNKFLRTGRTIVNRGIYFRRGHPAPDRTAGLVEQQLSERLRRLVHRPVVRAVIARPVALRAWRLVEALAPVSRRVTSTLQEIQPDLVLVSPSVWPKRPIEADFIHAAQKLGIPTIGYVNSWDNLTSKGTITVVPDRLFVWNEALADEARELHLVPRDRVRVTGAAYLDRVFEAKPTTTHDEMCAAMGCPDGRPYVVYLCTSRSLRETETDLAAEIADALLEELGADTAPTLVVRPHPTNVEPWLTFTHPGVVVYPRLGDQADSPDSWQQYFNQLSLASCVFGLNTTAFLESVVADRPCLTLSGKRLEGSQGMTGHFRHLVAGDFLEVSSDMAEVARRVRMILGGADVNADRRRAFAQSFLRPHGIDVPATSVVVQEIDDLLADTHRRTRPRQAERLALAKQQGARE